MPKWETKATSCAIDKLERRISSTGHVRARKRFSLLISIEDVDDIIIIVDSLENHVY